jgi:HEAT repeat protein
MKEVSDQELKKVIGDFLEMGHVDNIIAMFKRDQRYYNWTGELLLDDRFNVRLGLAVLFEELQLIQPVKTPLAIPSLQPLLNNKSSLIRGEAIGILSLIGTPKAIELISTLSDDTSPQVREMVAMTLEDD